MFNDYTNLSYSLKVYPLAYMYVCVWYFTQITSVGHLVTACDGAKMVKCSAGDKFKEWRSKLIVVEEPPTRMLGCPSSFLLMVIVIRSLSLCI